MRAEILSIYVWRNYALCEKYVLCVKVYTTCKIKPCVEIEVLKSLDPSETKNRIWSCPKQISSSQKIPYLRSILCKHRNSGWPSVDLRKERWSMSDCPMSSYHEYFCSWKILQSILQYICILLILLKRCISSEIVLIWLHWQNLLYYLLAHLVLSPP